MRFEKLGQRADETLDRALGYACLFFAGLFILMAFRDTTMLTWYQLHWDGRFLLCARLGLMLTVGARLARDRTWSVWEVLLGAFICGSLILSWRQVERNYILELAVLIVGAHGIDFRKIARVYVAATAAALAVTVVLALTGAIENLVYYRGGRMRMSFGIIYPTDFAARVFFLTAGYAWLRERRIRYAEIAVIAALGIFCIIFCDARNSALCLFLLAGGLLYVKLRRRFAGKREKEYVMHPAAQWLLGLSAPLLAGGMYLLTRLYDPDSGLLTKLDALLSGRLSLGHEGFAQYPLSLFGQDVYMNGFGGATETLERTEAYFFLDSSYINIALQFGLATLFAVVLLMLVSSLREKKNASWERLGILAVVALQCMFEHHLLELTYNVFLLLPLAVSCAGSVDPKRE